MTDLFEPETTSTTSLDMRRLQRRQRRATRRKWTLVAVAVGLILVALGASVARSFLLEFVPDENTIADYEGTGQGTVQVVIESGDTGADIAQTLYDADVIASTEAFIQATYENPDSSKITPGYYFMQREMSAENALLQLLDPNYRELRTITIPEGKTKETYFQKIADLTEYSYEEVEAAAADTAALGLPDQAGGDIEGWLFPSTYEFNPGVTPADVLSAMIAQTVTVLEANNIAEADWEETLTIASLIEREARLDEDRPLISSVIHNRLDQGMMLQLDSTVKYLSQTEGVFTDDDERAIDSPYNTYMYEGLPPGPIAAPGEASIQAAVAPADTDYLFFVTVNLTTGETKYATTYADHQVNVRELQNWYAENDTSD